MEWSLDNICSAPMTGRMLIVNNLMRVRARSPCLVSSYGWSGVLMVTAAGGGVTSDKLSHALCTNHAFGRINGISS